MRIENHNQEFHNAINLSKSLCGTELLNSRLRAEDYYVSNAAVSLYTVGFHTSHPP